MSKVQFAQRQFRFDLRGRLVGDLSIPANLPSSPLAFVIDEDPPFAGSLDLLYYLDAHKNPLFSKISNFAMLRAEKPSRLIGERL